MIPIRISRAACRLTLVSFTVLARLLLAALLLACLVPAFSQLPPPRPAAPAAPAAAPEATQEPPAPEPVPVADIAVQAEHALSAIRQMENRARIDEVIDNAGNRIPQLDRETAYRLREMRQLRSMSAALETVQGLEEELQDIELRVATVTRELTQAALQLDRDLKELDALGEKWTATIAAANQADAPAEVVERARDLNRSIAAVKKKVLDTRAEVLALQGRSTDVGGRIAEARQLLAEASERAVTRLLYRDGPPLWSTAFWETSIHSFSDEARENLVNQASAIADYAGARVSEFVLHMLFFVALLLSLCAARNRLDELCRDDEGLRRTRQIFDMPLVTAMLFAMLCSSWFYPRPPRAVWLLIGVLVAGPLLVFARRMVEPRIYPQIYSLVIFYLADRLRALFAPLPGIHRIMLLVEVLALILFFLTSLRRNAGAIAAAAPEQRFAWHVVRAGSRVALLLSLTVLASCVSGYVRFADLLMRSLLASAYTAVVLYVLTREGLVHGLLYAPPISFLAGVRRHRAHIAALINRWFKRIAFLLWIVLTLQASGFLPQARTLFESIWTASWVIGSLTLSVREICIFFLILWTAYLVSRLSRFLLEEEIFSRVRLDRGLPYAVSTTVRYAILLSGLVLALTAVGVDMTKFTIVAGALTVGIGFGLQNIVNNFVSGLIILFERPVKVGDTIQMDDIVGRVLHIGIRATVIHSTSGAEVIIPNGKLISDRVTNWTLSSQLRQIAVPVITKPGINVPHLKTILLDIARWNKQVLETPAPEVLFVKRGVDLYEFELRVWTADLDVWMQVRSDLTTAINEALENNEIPAQAAGPGQSMQAVQAVQAGSGG